MDPSLFVALKVRMTSIKDLLIEEAGQKWPA